MVMCVSCDGHTHLGRGTGPLSLRVLGAEEKFLTENTSLKSGMEYICRLENTKFEIGHGVYLQVSYNELGMGHRLTDLKRAVFSI